MRVALFVIACAGVAREARAEGPDAERRGARAHLQFLAARTGEPAAARPRQPRLGKAVAAAAGWDLRTGAAAVGAMAGVGIASELAQYANTALLIAYLRRRTRLDLPGLVDAAKAHAATLGPFAPPLYALAVACAQVVPFGLSAFLAVMFAGVLFGVWKGTLVVTAACAASAAGSRLVARAAQRRHPQLRLGVLGGRMAALEARLGGARLGTATATVALLRMSPLFPFVPTSYLLGLSALDWRAVCGGTFLGCLLPQAALVSAGRVGASALSGSISVPPRLAALGVAGSVCSVWLLGKLSQQALDKQAPH